MTGNKNLIFYHLITIILMEIIILFAVVIAKILTVTLLCVKTKTLYSVINFLVSTARFCNSDKCSFRGFRSMYGSCGHDTIIAIVYIQFIIDSFFKINKNKGKYHTYNTSIFLIYTYGFIHIMYNLL